MNWDIVALPPVCLACMFWHKAALQWRRDTRIDDTSPGYCRGSMALFKLDAAVVAQNIHHWTRGETGALCRSSSVSLRVRITSPPIAASELEGIGGQGRL